MPGRSKLAAGLRAREVVGRSQRAITKVANGVRAAIHFSTLAQPPLANPIGPGVAPADKSLVLELPRAATVSNNRDASAYVAKAPNSPTIRSSSGPVLKLLSQTENMLKKLSTVQTSARATAALAIPAPRAAHTEPTSTEYERVLPSLLLRENRLGRTRRLRTIDHYLPGRVGDRGQFAIASRQARLESPTFSNLTSARREQAANIAGASTVALHSAPTVVVRGNDDAGDIEHRISSALRRHRTELFDEMKREAARRERLRF